MSRDRCKCPRNKCRSIGTYRRVRSRDTSCRELMVSRVVNGVFKMGYHGKVVETHFF